MSDSAVTCSPHIVQKTVSLCLSVFLNIRPVQVATVGCQFGTISNCEVADSHQIYSVRSNRLHSTFCHRRFPLNAVWFDAKSVQMIGDNVARLVNDRFQDQDSTQSSCFPLWQFLLGRGIDTGPKSTRHYHKRSGEGRSCPTKTDSPPT